MTRWLVALLILASLAGTHRAGAASGKVCGTIKDRRMQPVANVEVTVQNAAFMDAVMAHTTSNRDGYFEVWADTKVEASAQTKPGSYQLFQNYPNPFNPSTRIVYNLKKNALVSLRVHNIKGQLVRKLIHSEYRTAGEHWAQWDGLDDAGRPTAAGIYLYTLDTPEFSTTGKMTKLDGGGDINRLFGEQSALGKTATEIEQSGSADLIHIFLSGPHIEDKSVLNRKLGDVVRVDEVVNVRPVIFFSDRVVMYPDETRVLDSLVARKQIYDPDGYEEEPGRPQNMFWELACDCDYATCTIIPYMATSAIQVRLTQNFIGQREIPIKIRQAPEPGETIPHQWSEGIIPIEVDGSLFKFTPTDYEGTPLSGSFDISIRNKEIAPAALRDSIPYWYHLTMQEGQSFYIKKGIYDVIIRDEVETFNYYPKLPTEPFDPREYLKIGNWYDKRFLDLDLHADFLQPVPFLHETVDLTATNFAEVLAEFDLPTYMWMSSMYLFYRRIGGPMNGATKSFRYLDPAGTIPLPFRMNIPHWEVDFKRGERICVLVDSAALYSQIVPLNDNREHLIETVLLHLDAIKKIFAEADPDSKYYRLVMSPGEKTEPYIHLQFTTNNSMLDSMILDQAYNLRGVHYLIENNYGQYGNPVIAQVIQRIERCLRGHFFGFHSGTTFLQDLPRDDSYRWPYLKGYNGIPRDQVTVWRAWAAIPENSPFEGDFMGPESFVARDLTQLYYFLEFGGEDPAANMLD